MAKSKKRRPSGAPKVHSAGVSARKVTVDGLTLEITPDALDDVELFDLIDRFGPDNPDAFRLVPKLLRGLFGPDQFGAVMGHLRDPATGRVSFDRAATFIAATFGELDPNS